VVDPLGGPQTEIVEFEHLSTPLGLVPRLTDLAPHRPCENLTDPLVLGFREREFCPTPVHEGALPRKKVGSHLWAQVDPGL
jgi:hypothetical protein